MKPGSYSWVTLVLVCLFAADLLGQSLSAQVSGSHRIVTIPVIVTNRTSEAVSGLTASAFSLSESHRDWPVESVLEVAPLVVGKNKAKVAFVVLDAIGSPRTAMVELRRGCLQLLADAVTDETPISLSEIDRDGLHVVHEVATPASILASALLQVDSESQFLTNRDRLRSMGGTPGDQSLLSKETESLRRFRRGSVGGLNMMRTFLTQLSAFQEVAAALQGARGRKTVVWVTGYFPIEVNDVQDSLDINSYGITSPFPVKSASVDYQKTIDMVNNAQISIFPVQVSDNKQTTDPRTTIGLRQFAQSTGGEAMAFTDSIENLVRRAEDRTTSYYLLTFQPESIKTDLKWRTLKVLVNAESLGVKSPNGLFVFGDVK